MPQTIVKEKTNHWKMGLIRTRTGSKRAGESFITRTYTRARAFCPKTVTWPCDDAILARDTAWAPFVPRAIYTIDCDAMSNTGIKVIEVCDVWFSQRAKCLDEWLWEVQLWFIYRRWLRVDSTNITHSSFLHMGQGFPHQLPVLENVILHPPCKTSRVRWRHDFPCTTFVQNCICFADFWS